MGTMYDRLTNLAADYNYTFTLNVQNAMVIRCKKDDDIHDFGGNSEERIIQNSDSQFWIVIQWSYLSSTDHATLFDLFNDPDKACGIANTWYFTPPSQYDAHVYVVRFDCDLETVLRNYQNYSAGNVILRVLGRKAE